RVTGVIFAVVALAHLLRIVMGWPVVVGDWAVPMWVSWVGFVVAGGLCYVATSLAMRRFVSHASRGEDKGIGFVVPLSNPGTGQRWGLSSRDSPFDSTSAT